MPWTEPVWFEDDNLDWPADAQTATPRAETPAGVSRAQLLLQYLLAIEASPPESGDDR